MKRSPDQMSFLEHLDELRRRLIKALLSLVVGFGACWSFRESLFDVLVQPLRRAFPDVHLIYTSPTEALLLYMKMSFFVGIFVVAPYILYQAWAFVAPGLYPHERVYALPFVVFGSLFFLGGAAFGHWILFPIALGFLGAFGGPNVEFLPRISEYWTFYSWFVLGLGIVFQQPIIIFVLARIGLVTPRFLLRHFKWAVFLAFVVSAVITPTTDAVTQSLLAGPIVGLYLLGVVVAWLFGKKREVPVSASEVRA